MTLVQANPDTCPTNTRLEELDSLFWRKSRADIIGRQEVRRGWNNNVGTPCAGGKYVLYHTASDLNNLGVGLMVRTHLVPTIMSLRLLGPRLLVARLRGPQRNLKVIVAHAPCAEASNEDRTAFYGMLDDAVTAASDMEVRVVLIDANEGPGHIRLGREHIVGPHGIPYSGGKGTIPNCQAFNKFCYEQNLCVGHTWFKHKISQKRTFYPNHIDNGKPRDMDHVLIDGRSSSCLEDVRTAPGAIISTSSTYVDGLLAGHRAVVARLRCRLAAKAGNVPMAPYIRDDCVEPDIQKKIQASLAKDEPLYKLANNALTSAGHFGLPLDSTGVPPCPNTEVHPRVLYRAVDNLVEAGNNALVRAASAHAPVTQQERRFKKPQTTEPTRQLSFLKGLTHHTRLRIRTFGQNTLYRAVFETLRAWRLLRLHLRGARKGRRGVPALGLPNPRPRRRVGGQAESLFWPIRDVHHRVLYLRMVYFVEAFYAILNKRAKRSAARDRARYWDNEAESVEQVAAAGRTQDLYQQVQYYAGRKRAAGALYLTDPHGNPLESPEERMSEWTREFKHRFNPQVRVQYDCAAEGSDEEWQDDARDDDATSAEPEERER